MIIKKNGFSLIKMILTLIIIGSMGILGSQIGIAYINQNSMKSAVKSALIEAKQNDIATSSTVEGNIERKLSVGTIELDKDNILVIKKGSSFEVNITYVKEIKITNKMKLVIDLSFIEITPN